MKDKCDKCHSKIIHKICSCGVWSDKDYPQPWYQEYLEKILIYYAETPAWADTHVFTGDHHNGMCFAIFKGNYEDTQKVKKFIKELKNEN